VKVTTRPSKGKIIAAADIKPGETINYDGVHSMRIDLSTTDFHLKNYDRSVVYFVDLEDGCVYTLDPTDEVTPENAELMIDED
jgi:hypothetical protein